MSVEDTNWCVTYRTGNTRNYQWHRTEPMTRSAAMTFKDASNARGEHAYVVKHSQSVAIGLPSTYAAYEWEERAAKTREEIHALEDEVGNHYD